LGNYLFTIPKDFFQWINDIADWRDQKKIKYGVRDLIATGLMIFLLKLESRHRFNEQRGRGEFNGSVFPSSKRRGGRALNNSPLPKKGAAGVVSSAKYFQA